LIQLIDGTGRAPDAADERHAGENGAMPIGSVTRGTTGTNRLRRVDRFIAQLPAMRRARPLVVDLGFGASATTTLEMHERLSRVHRDVDVVGIEIDPARVALASLSARRGVAFRRGGFEIPLGDGRSPTVIRAFNVLRQYDESQVLEQWRRMAGRLEAGGTLVEGTCSELGRVASWVNIAADGPTSLTLSLRLEELEWPSILAERLPKALIHRNVPGERIHPLLQDLDREWRFAAHLAVFSPARGGSAPCGASLTTDGRCSAGLHAGAWAR